MSPHDLQSERRVRHGRLAAPAEVSTTLLRMYLSLCSQALDYVFTGENEEGTRRKSERRIRGSLIPYFSKASPEMSVKERIIERVEGEPQMKTRRWRWWLQEGREHLSSARGI